jgi:hypothetical protein
VVERSDTTGVSERAFDPAGVAGPGADLGLRSLGVESQLERTSAATLPGSGFVKTFFPGGIAPLNHRLIAVTPAGVVEKPNVSAECPASLASEDGALLPQRAQIQSSRIVRPARGS